MNSNRHHLNIYSVFILRTTLLILDNIMLLLIPLSYELIDRNAQYDIFNLEVEGSATSIYLPFNLFSSFILKQCIN